MSFKDGSAPFCISISKALCLPEAAAHISGVTPSLFLESMSRPSETDSLSIMDGFPPCAAEWSRLNPLLSFKDGSAPFCISISKTLCLPESAAHISGVMPSSSLESTSRPSDNSLLRMDVFPPSAAKWSKLDPSLFFKDGSAPFCISISNALCLSEAAAVISGVTPSLRLESMSRPSDNSLSIMDRFPPLAAKWRKLEPLLCFKDGSAPFCISISKALCLP